MLVPEARVSESHPAKHERRWKLPPPRKLHSPDAVTVLSIYLFLLVAVPSDRGIAPLGGAGSLSTIFGLGILLWWIWHQVRHRRPDEFRRVQPVRISFVIFVLSILASYTVASLTSMPLVDQNASNLVLVNVGSYAGVVLLANDGIDSRERFLVLLRRTSLAGGLYAALGLMQFFTGLNIVDSIQIPGLASGGTGGVDTRGDFVRPESTARHALEYAAVLSMVLPIALTMAIGESRKRMIIRWFPTAAILMAAFLSVTRSALLGIVAVLLVLIPTWEPAVKKMALWAACGGAVVMYALVPGLSGTILGMFSGNDPSVDSRTDSYSVIGGYLRVSPLFGRGLGTMGPQYRIFDNQYIGFLIETGVIGTAAFAMLVLTAMVTTFLRRRAPDPLIGALGPALSAAVLAGALLSAFFDSFHFPQAVGMLFLMIGLSGGHWNLRQTVPAELDSPDAHGADPHENTGARRLSGSLRRRWYVGLAVLLMFIPMAMSAWSETGVYYAKFNIELQAPPGATKGNPLRTEASSVVHFAAMVQRLYEGGHANASVLPTSAPLYGSGLRDAVAVYLPSAGGQWQTNFNSPSIAVEIVKAHPDDVIAAAEAVTADIEKLTVQPQEQMGIWEKSRITGERQPAQVTVEYMAVRPKYALVAIAALAVASAMSSAIVVDRGIRQLRRIRKTKH
ncbi:O-antigen ligase family protein [Arthrobacter sp. LAPM80]|uniref:O-antigen ligase family protein n=1 Tax=Arthrobacter sp. LAPM80 TaxID=3141788 RepID=UPI00398B1D4A